MRSRLLLTAFFLFSPAAVHAHAEWFLEGQPAADPPVPILFWIAAAIAVVMFFLLRPLSARPVGGTLVKFLHLQATPFVGLAKNVWSVGLGAVLLIFALQNLLFSADRAVTTTLGEVIRMLMVFSGLGFVVVVFKRYAAALLLIALLLFWIQYGLTAFVLHSDYLGLGLAFLLAYSQGKFSVRFAMRYARIGLGVALIAAALHEKVLSPGISVAFLADHAWNVLSPFGVSDMLFISLTAVVELFLGALLVMNVFPRFAALLVFVTFLLTFALLGSSELLGHAVPGLMAVFIALYGTDYFHFTEEQEIEL